MAKFTKKGGKGTPGISTASLPDIIFMLLFFFMVTTTMREATLLVRINPPKATEVQKLEKKSLVDYIYIGPPIRKQMGTDSRIQLNDQFATDMKEIREFVELGRSQREEAEKANHYFIKSPQRHSNGYRYRCKTGTPGGGCV